MDYAGNIPTDQLNKQQHPKNDMTYPKGSNGQYFDGNERLDQNRKHRQHHHWDEEQRPLKNNEIDRIEARGYAPTYSKITRVNGKELYSQTQAAYPGITRQQEVIPQPGLIDGVMPPGQFNTYNYPKIDTNKIGVPLSDHNRDYGLTTNISPYPRNKEDTTTNNRALHTTIRDLMNQLEEGAGLRTNKYLIEFDVPMHLQWAKPEKLNVLCQATSFPQRTISTVPVWRFGRKYNLRGETTFPDTWTMEFVDDSEFTIYTALMLWMYDIDDTAWQDTALDVYDDIVTKVRNDKLELLPKELGTIRRFNYLESVAGFIPMLERYKDSDPNYQTDITVFQLDQNGNKVRGIRLQNAFISDLSEISYSDSEKDTLTKFTCTITYSESEFIPLSIKSRHNLDTSPSHYKNAMADITDNYEKQYIPDAPLKSNTYYHNIPEA